MITEPQGRAIRSANCTENAVLRAATRALRTACYAAWLSKRPTEKYHHNPRKYARADP